MTVHDLTLHELHDRLRSRELSTVELAEVLFDRIEATDGAIGSYLAVCREQGMEDARRAGRAGSPPVTCVLQAAWHPGGAQGRAPHRGRRYYLRLRRYCDGFTPPYDGTAVRRLKEAGAVVLGKTNMDEFAMGSSTENSGYSVTHNPWNLDHVPGGSSGGSAAAVAAGQCIAALGHRHRRVDPPAGVVLRHRRPETHLRAGQPLRRGGLCFFAGPGGPHDPGRHRLRAGAPDHRRPRPRGLHLRGRAGAGLRRHAHGRRQGLRIGVPKEYFAAGLQPEVEQAARQGITELEKAGAVVTEVSLPRNDYAVAAYYVIAAAEASSNLARYDGMRYGPRAQAEDLTSTYMKSRAQGFGHEVKRRIMLGTYVLSAGYYDAYYLKAQKVRTLLKQDMESALTDCDAIVTPTCPTTAFKFDEMTHDPLQM